MGGTLQGELSGNLRANYDTDDDEQSPVSPWVHLYNWYSFGLTDIHLLLILVSWYSRGTLM